MKSIIFLLLVFICAEGILASTSSLCPDEEGYYYTNYRRRNPQQGGFVAHTAFVDDNDNLFLARTAAVCGNAQLYGRARILGKVVISGNAEVYGGAIIKGNVRIKGESYVYGSARIQDQALVVDSNIGGKARLKGWYKAISETLDKGVHSSPQFSQAELNEQGRMARQNANNKKAAIDRQKAARKRNEEARESQRVSKEARKLTEKAAAALDFYSVMLKSTKDSFMIDNLGFVAAKVSSSDPCTMSFYAYSSHNDAESGHYNKKWTVDLRKSIAIQKIGLLKSFMWTDLSNLSNGTREAILDNLSNRHTLDPNRYYLNNRVRKVNMRGLVTFSKKVIDIQESDSPRDVPDNTTQLHKYLDHSDLYFGIVFTDLSDSLDFYSNIASAYKSYCP